MSIEGCADSWHLYTTFHSSAPSRKIAGHLASRAGLQGISHQIHTKLTYYRKEKKYCKMLFKYPASTRLYSYNLGSCWLHSLSIQISCFINLESTSNRNIQQMSSHWGVVAAFWLNPVSVPVLRELAYRPDPLTHWADSMYWAMSSSSSSRTWAQGGRGSARAIPCFSFHALSENPGYKTKIIVVSFNWEKSLWFLCVSLSIEKKSEQLGLKINKEARKSIQQMGKYSPRFIFPLMSEGKFLFWIRQDKLDIFKGC